MHIQNGNNINFQANLVAKTANLNIYKLNCQNDINALKELYKKTDFKKLMPEISEKESARWREMFEYAIDNAQNSGNVTYVESFKNKICGIITYFPDSTTVIDCICTIPIEVGQKVKLAGKTLFYQVFKDFIDFNGKKIKLSAIVNGPYNTINKYKDLGFKETTDITYTYTDMIANKYMVKEVFDGLKNLIKYKQLPEEKVDLKTLIG